MPGISVPGIGSGLDVSGIVSQLMQLEARPLTLLDQKEAAVTSRISAYGTLKGAVAEFQAAMQGLSTLASFQGHQATSADTTLFTATASSSAIPSTYGVEVKQLAQSQKLISKSFTNTTDVVGHGVITLQFGTTVSSVFTADATKTPVTVTITSNQNTLSGIRDAINASNAGVSAAILNDGTGNRLVINGVGTGASNSLRISVTDSADASNTDDAGLSQLAWDPAGALGSGKNLTQTQTAQNAILKVDGVDNIQKSSNVVTDVVQGVTLSLLKTSAAGVATGLTVTRNTGSVRTAIEGFVKAYNDLGQTVAGLTAYNAETKEAGALQGDSSALSITRRMRAMLSAPLGGNPAYTLLSQIGVAFQRNGTLALDATKLDKAMASNFLDLAPLFATYGKVTDGLVRYSAAKAETVAGNYAINISQVATRGVLNGPAAPAFAHTAGTFTAPYTVNAGNSPLALKVDGIQTATLAIAQATYTTGVALATELQTKINADSSLKNAGAAVTVTFDNATSRFVITSDRYGAASSVEITTAGVDFVAGAGTTGLDVTGTLGGLAATGNGRFLTGVSGNPSGIKLEIAGGTTGDRGTISYAVGYAGQLDAFAAQLLADNGTLDSRSDGLNKSILDIQKTREVLGRRLTTIEERYRREFSALDVALASMRSTSSWLAQQLSSLPRPG